MYGCRVAHQHSSETGKNVTFAASKVAIWSRNRLFQWYGKTLDEFNVAFPDVERMMEDLPEAETLQCDSAKAFLTNGHKLQNEDTRLLFLPMHSVRSAPGEAHQKKDPNRQGPWKW